MTDLRTICRAADAIRALVGSCEGIERNPFHESYMSGEARTLTMDRQRSLRRLDERWRRKGVAPPAICVRDPDELVPTNGSVLFSMSAP